MKHFSLSWGISRQKERADSFASETKWPSRYEAHPIKKVPRILFKNIKSKSIPVAVNVNGTSGGVPQALGAVMVDLKETIIEGFKHTIAPADVLIAAVHEVVLKGKDINATQLPAMVDHDTETGHYTLVRRVAIRDRPV